VDCGHVAYLLSAWQQASGFVACRLCSRVNLLTVRTLRQYDAGTRACHETRGLIMRLDHVFVRVKCT
jgi:hypothetical protein